VKIVDIQETQIVDFRVSWAAYRAWLMVNTAANAYVNTVAPTTSTELLGYANGFIVVVPFTKLQSPLSTTVYVNVYVSSDDMQVNGTTSKNLPTQRMIYGQSRVVDSGDLSDTSKAPVPVTGVELNESSADTSLICEEHFGEQPLSFRALLKRYMSVQDIQVLTTACLQQVWTRPIIPNNTMAYMRTSRQYNDLFSYVRMAYLGMRGSVRYRFHYTRAQAFGSTSFIRVSLATPIDTLTEGMTYEAGLSYAQPEGTVNYIARTMGAIECEMPFYTNNLFVYANYGDTLLNATNEVDNAIWYRYIRVEKDAEASPEIQYLIADFATGEDFTFMRYQGAPFYST